MEKKNFEYDSEIDNFYIYSDNADEEIAGSVPFGNFIYDISVSGKVVGLEIDNASKVFNIEPSLLKATNSATISISTNRNMLLLGFKIVIGEKQFVYSNIIPQNKINIVA